MSNIQTVLRVYSIDTEKMPGAYEAMIERIHAAGIAKPWSTIDMTRGYTADPKAWDFRAKMEKIPGAMSDTGAPIELETAHLFDDQWNSAPMPGFDTGARLFNWVEYRFANRKIKAGYWLEQTEAMGAALRDNVKCGYCGHMEPASLGHAFCPACLGSEYLEKKDLHLTRLAQVRDTFKPRAPLTEAETAERVPLWRDAQLHGNTERDKKRIAQTRARIIADADKAIANATNERAGLLWLMDHGIKVDNVIYYNHRSIFSFGWRQPVDAEIVSAILDVISEFPFAYEIKCADGRTLSGNIG